MRSTIATARRLSPRSARARAAILVAVLAIVLTVALESLLFAHAMSEGTGGRWILPLDDAYIHLQYAVQAARGHPLQYDDLAAPSSGATSLLYPFVLAVAWRLGFQGDLLSAFAFAFGSACLLMSALLLARIASCVCSQTTDARWPVRPAWVGLLAAFLMLSNGALLWGFLSGMEGGLLIVLLLATLEAFVAEAPRRAALCAGLLALTRPEATILVGLLALVAVVRLRWGAVEKRGWSRLYLLPPVLGLIQPTLNLSLTGSLTANGMRAKSWLYNVPAWPLSIARSIVQTGIELWLTFLTGLVPEDLASLPGSLLRPPAQALLYVPPLVTAIGLGYLVWRVRRQWRERHLGWAALLLLWIVVGLGITATMGTASWHFHRYHLPFFVLGLLAGAVALPHIALWLGAEKRGRWLFAVLSVLALAGSAWSVPGFVWRYREATRTTLSQQVRLGEWIRDNLPEGAVVGVHDAGAIRYYGQRTVYDMVGLAAPPANAIAWRNGSGSIYELMEQAPSAPGYFATYDSVWALPYFVNTPVFADQLFAVEAEDLAGVVAASDRQAVYAADWRLRNSGDQPYQGNVLARTQGLQLVDSLDVANLADEQSHGYSWWQALRKTGFPSDAFQLTYHLSPHQHVMDGGRLITGGEAFEVKSVPGEDMLLIGRFLGQGPVHLQVEVNGQPLGAWGYAPLPGRWQEQAFRVAGSYITGPKTRIEITVDPSQPGFEFHRPFYYWCYQGTLAEEPLEIAQPLQARVGDDIVLLGYSLKQVETESGYQLELDLYWQAARPVAGDYKVFVHWSDEKDTILVQQDNRPGHDLRPTWTWRPDETVRDHYSLSLPTRPRQPVSTILYVGMYDAQGGNRLPVAGGDAANRLELAGILLPH
jgi:hypothetical protein